MADTFLLDYTKRLTGLDPTRVEEAWTRVSELGIQHLQTALVEAQTIDAAVSAVLLVDSLDLLGARGVERTKLISKLRNDKDVWPTWAEIRAAAHLARYLEDDAELLLEPGRSRGRHPDFRARRPQGSPFRFLPYGESNEVSIEFKALGLSDEEVVFCARARASLELLKPKEGFITLQAPLDFQGQLKIDRAQRREMERRTVRLARQTPRHAVGLSGTVLVAMGTEDAYLARLKSRLAEALQQLPPDHECWVAFHWSNGAPLSLISRALRALDLPRNVLGVVFLGSTVAFPHPDIHNFLLWAAVPQSGDDEIAFESAVDDELARLIFERVDGSSGVRATVVRGAAVGGGPRNLLVRDGAQRILPYVLLITPDLHDVPGASASWLNAGA